LNFLLDTNTVVTHLRRGKSTSVSEKLATIPPANVYLCSIVVAELIYGAYRSDKPALRLKQVTEFCSRFACLDFDTRAAHEYGRIRMELEGKGTPIGPNDLLIAAIALSNAAVLVTSNFREFKRVSGLTLEDWQ
jgi:tRNA(fMet)-specific endonuclease VapC